jgi:thiol-disulfide isomerase/thioredoxin
MRVRVLLLPIIFLLIASVSAQDEPASNVIPDPIMNAKLKPLHGTKPIKLSDYRDKKAMVLALWATWCGPCVFSMPELNRIGRDFSSRGVE